ncbi:MAG: DUF551 domain-containing protein [Candidatus Marinimicrobia bacterium]|nr:DUF551 domain-containing protein [Candidatus Neomarinimicrobiota bacterium]
MNWIKVNAELPQKDELVFVLIKNEIPSTAKFVKDINGFYFDGLEVENVTHWLQIPELKKGNNLNLDETLKPAF